MSAGPIAVTLDLDWACEPAIEETLTYLRSEDIPATVFVTHASPCVVAHLGAIEVGLHPYFDPESSHGRTLEEVVTHVLELPHNLPAFRCHRFAVSNAAREAMATAGFRISSNVCTDLELVPPFRDRFGLLEIPIFLEDGGYLYRGHSLHVEEAVEAALVDPGPKVLLLHPMHWAINTPEFGYMSEIKRSVTREAWNEMSRPTLERLRSKHRGIRDFLADLVGAARRLRVPFTTLGLLAREHAVARKVELVDHPTSIRTRRA